GAAGGEEFLREIGRGVGKGGGGLVEWGRGTRGDSSGPSRPNQHLAFLVPSKLVHLHNFVREECEQVVVELKLDLERTIGDTATRRSISRACSKTSSKVTASPLRHGWLPGSHTIRIIPEQRM